MGDLFASGGVSSYPTSLDTFTTQTDATPTIAFDSTAARASKINNLAQAIVNIETALGAPASSGHTIKDEGTPLTARTGLNFVGDSVVATDDSGNNETDVTINHLATALHTASQPSDGGYYSVGLSCLNNSVTPNTQFDCSADLVALRDLTNSLVKIRTNTGTVTNNVSTAGPAVNGRDQAGAFSASSWIHFYWIWDGTTLATVSSATAPPTGPTFPTGYTHWAYIGAVFFDSGSALLRVRIRGRTAFYGTQGVTRPLVLNSGSATSETTVDVSAVVPPNASWYNGKVATWQLTSDGSGVINASAQLRVNTGVNLAAVVYTMSGLGASAVQRADPASEILFPNVGQAFFYIWTVTTGTSPALSMHLMNYTMPNGG